MVLFVAIVSETLNVFISCKYGNTFISISSLFVNDMIVFSTNTELLLALCMVCSPADLIAMESPTINDPMSEFLGIGLDPGTYSPLSELAKLKSNLKSTGIVGDIIGAIDDVGIDDVAAVGIVGIDVGTIGAIDDVGIDDVAAVGIDAIDGNVDKDDVDENVDINLFWSIMLFKSLLRRAKTSHMYCAIPICFGFWFDKISNQIFSRREINQMFADPIINGYSILIH